MNMKYVKMFEDFNQDEDIVSLLNKSSYDDFEEFDDMLSNGERWFKNRVIAKIEDRWFCYEKGFYQDVAEWNEITYGDPQETDRLVFEQDAIPNSDDSEISKYFFDWLKSKGFNVSEVYLGET